MARVCLGAIAYGTTHSILGVSAWIPPSPHPPRAVTLTLGALVVVAVILIARPLALAGDTLTAVCVVATGSLLASPIAWSHHWGWFIPAPGTGWGWAWAAGSISDWWLRGS